MRATPHVGTLSQDRLAVNPAPARAPVGRAFRGSCNGSCNELRLTVEVCGTARPTRTETERSTGAWCCHDSPALQGGGLGFKSLRLHAAARVRSPGERSLRKIRMSLASCPTTSPRPSPNGCGSPAAPSPRWAPRPSSRRWPATWTASIRCGRLAAPLPPNFSGGGDTHKARAGGLLGPTPAATSRGQRCCLALWQARAPSDPV